MIRMSFERILVSRVSLERVGRIFVSLLRFSTDFKNVKLTSEEIAVQKDMGVYVSIQNALGSNNCTTLLFQAKFLYLSRLS